MKRLSIQPWPVYPSNLQRFEFNTIQRRRSTSAALSTRLKMTAYPSQIPTEPASTRLVAKLKPSLLRNRTRKSSVCPNLRLNISSYALFPFPGPNSKRAGLRPKDLNETATRNVNLTTLTVPSPKPLHFKNETVIVPFMDRTENHTEAKKQLRGISRPRPRLPSHIAAKENRTISMCVEACGIKGEKRATEYKICERHNKEMVDESVGVDLPPCREEKVKRRKKRRHKNHTICVNELKNAIQIYGIDRKAGRTMLEAKESHRVVIVIPSENWFL